jgi:hypothetical protein
LKYFPAIGNYSKNSKKYLKTEIDASMIFTIHGSSKCALKSRNYFLSDMLSSDLGYSEGSKLRPKT